MWSADVVMFSMVGHRSLKALMMNSSWTLSWAGLASIERAFWIWSHDLARDCEEDFMSLAALLIEETVVSRQCTICLEVFEVVVCVFPVP